MFVMATIMMASLISDEAVNAFGEEKSPSSPLSALLSDMKGKDARECLLTSCGSFGCCSGNCQTWCRQ
ncbi:hypothetical protein I4U23_016679 [Adineta vaga]|nr:hypothetical protein I4U23_016679 [Adineta vaga]